MNEDKKRSCSVCGHRCRKRQFNNLSHFQKDENDVMVLVEVKHWWCDPLTRAEMMKKMHKLPGRNN